MPKGKQMPKGLFQLSVGKDIRLREILDAAGLNAEHVAALLVTDGVERGLTRAEDRDTSSLSKWWVEQLQDRLEQARFDRYNHLLLSLDDQLDRLRSYNREYWDNRLTDEQLAAVDTSGDLPQHASDLTTFHVQFDSLEETVEMWWRVHVGEQPKHWRWDELKLNSEHLRLLTSNVRQYEPGIHRVRINLVANWEPENGRTVEEVRDGAKGTGEILAQLEVLSAYGIHSELLREQDGENLPYSDMPGTDVTVPGGSEPCALYVYWDPGHRKANLSASWVGNRDSDWAAPVLRGK